MHHDSGLTQLAQNLRRNMTKEERKLWYEYLSSYPLRFRRQVAVGGYIMDFYCAAAKLCIELDGSQHFEEAGLKRDAQRTAFLEKKGIEILRFSNSDIMKNLRGVCDMIDLTVKQRCEEISR